MCLSGNVRTKGLFEVPFGYRIRDIIETFGDTSIGGIRMVQLGGSSGPCLPVNMLGLRLDYNSMGKHGLSFGSGAIIVIDQSHSVLEIVRNTLEFFKHESCGKCTPCREGIEHLLILLDRFILGVALRRDLEVLNMLVETVAANLYMRPGPERADGT